MCRRRRWSGQRLRSGRRSALCRDRRCPTESLKLTIERVLPYWESDDPARCWRSGETVIVSAHGNSLRALVKHLSGISDEDITGLEIPTGQPIVYDFDDKMQPGERYYLKDA
jgi:2,3-bisphosphoglycerate-dependent phosphoglycerate mutase